MTVRVHIPAHDETAELGSSLCGRHAVLLGETATCATCLRMRGSRREWTRGISWEEALTDLAALLSPRMTPYPKVTPDSWRGMRCRDGGSMTPAQWEIASREGTKHPSYRICSCDFCEHDLREAKVRAEHEQSQQIRPHRKYAYPFGSWRAALAVLLMPIAGVRSSAGSAMARASETAKLGTHIQTTLRTDRDSLEVRRVDLAVDVERCVLRAFADEQGRRGFSLTDCVAFMIDTVREDRSGRVPQPAEYVDDLNVSLARAVQRHGRKHVQIELALAGLTPWPRDPRLVSEIERRAKEQRRSA